MPIDGNVITPKFRGERVALRVSNDDHDELRRGDKWLGADAVVTDLDTMKRYFIRAATCEYPKCYCDAEIWESSLQ